MIHHDTLLSNKYVFLITNGLEIFGCALCQILYIMIPHDKMLMSVEALQYALPDRRTSKTEIPQMEYNIVRGHCCAAGQE